MNQPHVFGLRDPAQLTLAFEPSGKVVALYQVSVTVYENGHTCSRLTRLDTRVRRMVPEKLACNASGLVTRLALLQLLLASVADALADAEGDSPRQG